MGISCRQWINPPKVSVCAARFAWVQMKHVTLADIIGITILVPLADIIGTTILVPHL